MTEAGSRVTTALNGTETEVYVTRPEGSPPWPGVLVLHEVFGLNDDIERIADRFAANGYLAAAPELMSDGRIRGIVRSFRHISRGDGAMVDRGRAALRWVADRDDVDSDRVGVTGFCMGGGFAFLLGTDPVASATAPNYGAIPDDETLRDLAPVVASFGGEDRLSEDVDRLEAAVADAEIPNDVKVYPGVGHSFMNQADLHPVFDLFGSVVMSAGYDEAAAEDAWERILSFFDAYL
jgi:carboxymethylenebutenolidase